MPPPADAAFENENGDSSEHRMTREKRLRKQFGWRWLTAVAVAISLSCGIIVAEKAAAQNIRAPRSATTQETLSKYSWDLTAAAAKGRFDSFTERRQETD